MVVSAAQPSLRQEQPSGHHVIRAIDHLLGSSHPLTNGMPRAKTANQLALQRRQTVNAVLSALHVQDDPVTGLSQNIANNMQPQGLTADQTENLNKGLIQTIRTALTDPSKTFSELLDRAFVLCPGAPELMFVNAETTPNQIDEAFAHAPSFICVMIERHTPPNIIEHLNRVRSTHSEVLCSVLRSIQLKKRDFATMFGMFAQSEAFRDNPDAMEFLTALSQKKSMDRFIVTVNVPTEAYEIDGVLLSLVVLVTNQALINFRTIMVAA
jgi:hypothetical protein